MIGPAMIGPRMRAGAVVLFVFAAGALTGVAVERHHLWPGTAPTSSGSSASAHTEALANLREAVGLSDEQVAQVHALMANQQQVVQLSWEELRPEVQAAMRHVHAEIAKLLRPDQLSRYHDWIVERRQQSRRPQP